MTLKIEGLEKPKRKRGRPKKIKDKLECPEAEQTSETVEPEVKKEEEEDEIDENGRKRRRRKVPQRFMEAVQGKELDRILREEGAIDANDTDDAATDEEPFPGSGEIRNQQSDGNEEIAGGKVLIVF